jgi:hypothetical protein
MKSSEFTLQINDSSSHLRTSSICHVIVVEVITLLMLVVSSRQNVVFARRCQNTLDLLHPRAKICRKFNIGDRVFARNYRGKVIWITASVIKVTGPCSYLLKSNEGYFLRRHIDQLRPCYSTGITDSSYSDDWPILLYWYN